MEGQNIQWATGITYIPEINATEKKISVKVTSGDKSVTSEAVTIGPLVYTVEMYRWGNTLCVEAKSAEDLPYMLTAQFGFAVQWQRNSIDIPGEINYNYNVDPDVDAGKKIRAKVTGHGSTVYSKEFSVPTPQTSFSYVNLSGRPTAEVDEIAAEVWSAYNNNINRCREAINNNLCSSWSVIFTEDGDRYATISESSNKMTIYLSCGWFDSIKDFDENMRQNLIGTVLRNAAGMAQTVALEYSDNYQLRQG